MREPCQGGEGRRRGAGRADPQAGGDAPGPFPALRQVVFDATDARRLAEFYRRLLGYAYRPGDEPPAAGDDARGRDWLVLRGPSGDPVLDVQHERVLALGGRLLADRSGDDEEPWRVYADAAGHPFCIFVAAP